MIHAIAIFGTIFIVMWIYEAFQKAGQVIGRRIARPACDGKGVC